MQQKCSKDYEQVNHSRKSRLAHSDSQQKVSQNASGKAICDSAKYPHLISQENTFHLSEYKIKNLR